ncbi:hypothetical protein [Sediminibacter sp. Hel_I_10]|uniref:hypothetical protein n=1 Tax=Sediminibacter sp. Hel_I_10 TaxID=1392490 RepID=UPI00047B04E7|nr:hypothetical protein [Sediminibacter sp. Hel_I_10]
MKWFISFFAVCSISFSQVEVDTTSASKTIGLLGYQFHNGQLGVTSLGKNTYLQTGILQIKTADALVTEMPILFKKQVANDFALFFGTKLNLVQNPLFSVLNQGNPQQDYGASIEAGLQYDIKQNMMLELRYSVPLIKNKGFYPTVPTIDYSPMLRLGTGIKF